MESGSNEEAHPGIAGAQPRTQRRSGSQIHAQTSQAEGDEPEGDEPEGDETEDEGGVTPAAGRRKRSAAVQRPYPRRSLEDALKIPRALKDQNGGNPWSPAEVAKAVGLGNSDPFYYLTAASRDYGLSEGTRNAATIALTPLGREAVYPSSPEAEMDALRRSFFSIPLFQKVVDFYGGSKLPEARFLANALETTFQLDPRTHSEFVPIFEANCRFLGIGADYASSGPQNPGPARPVASSNQAPAPSATETVAIPVNGSDKVCFVIMPFVERSDDHPTGFFDEVFNSIFKPAATAAGFVVKTAKRQGSDVIQSTIVTDLLRADLVLADLTEHNPNVLFELGMRMARDLPVALVRAKGTGPIFDVDNMLRVQDYSPNLWTSTVEKDVPVITEHIIATWENRETAQTFMKILGQGQ